MAPSPDFLAAFRAAASADGVMPFDRFMELALYHPEVGYYRRSRSRIGREPGTDFVTASTAGPEFGRLVAAAAASLLAGQGANPGDCAFVEIGAETPGGVLEGIEHPFGARRALSLGDDSDLSGPCVLFSNELFDAQPFRRLVRRGGAWKELGVACRESSLVEIELSAPPELAGLLAPLPAEAADGMEGYVFDAPVASVALLERIAQSPWTGLFLAFDYGKSWLELIQATPAGTARGYYRHHQFNDLLARPGEQDLTCHVCWDWLADSLSRHGFTPPQLDSQESFFVHHAGAYAASLVAAEAAHPSARKSALLQLLHPAHFGQKFQVLHAFRL